MSSKQLRVPVSERAIIQRINRRLRDDLCQLKKYRGGRWQSDLGSYYVVDLDKNTVIEGHVNLKAKAEDMGVIAKHEELRKTNPLSRKVGP